MCGWRTSRNNLAPPIAPRPDLAEAHKLCFAVSGVGVVSGGRFQVSLACPDSEWLDLRRNVFELGGRLPQAPRSPKSIHA